MLVVVAVGKWKTTCRVLLSSLLFLPCSHFLLPHFSPPGLFDPVVTMTCSAAFLAARHVRRRPRAVRMCGPLFTRIHQAFLHHVMCLFDTSFSSCIEFVSILSSTLLSRVVPSPSSCSSLGFCISFLYLERLCFSHLPFLLFLSLGPSRLSFSLFLSLRFSLLLLLSPSLFWRLPRSPLFFSRLLRPSLLFIFLLMLAFRPLLQTWWLLTRQLLVPCFWPCLFLFLFLFFYLLLPFSFCLLFFFLSHPSGLPLLRWAVAHPFAVFSFPSLSHFAARSSSPFFL